MSMLLRRKTVPSDRQRLDALYSADSMIIEHLREQVRLWEGEYNHIVDALVKGELVFCGKPVKVEWPEGRPAEADR